MEWPTPGLWPGVVGRKSSVTCSALLVFASAARTKRALRLWSPTFSALKVLSSRCRLEHFLQSPGFKCLPSTRVISWQHIKTMSKVQVVVVAINLVCRLAISSLGNREKEGGRGRECKLLSDWYLKFWAVVFSLKLYCGIYIWE